MFFFNSSELDFNFKSHRIEFQRGLRQSHRISLQNPYLMEIFIISDVPGNIPQHCKRVVKGKNMVNVLTRHYDARKSSGIRNWLEILGKSNLGGIHKSNLRIGYTIITPNGDLPGGMDETHSSTITCIFQTEKPSCGGVQRK